MAYVQHTKCESPSSHSQMNQYVQTFIYGGPFAAIMVLVIAAAGAGPLCMGIAAEVYAMLSLIAYCDWWLYHRLVCLPGSHEPTEKTAVGMLMSVEPPGEKDFPDNIDTDYSINLLLPPGQPGVSQAVAEASAPFGELIREHPDTAAEGLPWTAYDLQKDTAVLHVEFEGGGPKYTMIGAQVGLGISTAALIACLANALIGTIIAVVLAILALLAALIGLLAGLGSEGSASDVGLPSLNTSDGPNPDVLGVAGHWVYDSGHNNLDQGWNELHPCKVGEKLGTWTGDWGAVDVNGTPTPVDQLIDGWTAEVAAAADPLTVEEQGKPEHGWEMHPDVDGCEPSDEEDGEPIEPPH
ncbi:MAG: hypothetical protein M3340_13040 [Actinomycetota bacterium]|nr:hypothetical protein [Actinomycetota bacterium]